MALVLTSLSVMANAAGSTWFNYTSTTDNQAAIAAANYFNGAANIMNPGDMIVSNDSANLNQVYFVKSVTAGVVVIASALAAPVGEGEAPPPPPPGNGETEPPPPPLETVSHGRQRASR